MMLLKAWVLINALGLSFAPGPGYGGSCFPKDTLALVQTAEDYNRNVSIIKDVVRYNAERKMAMADRVISSADGKVSGKTIAVLGLAFKPETDDMRDSPALDILPRLAAEGTSQPAPPPWNRPMCRLMFII